MAIGCLQTVKCFDVTTLDDVEADTNQTRWPCDPRMIPARFARDEIINLAARRLAPRASLREESCIIE